MSRIGSLIKRAPDEVGYLRPTSLLASAAVVTLAGALLSLNRFGGLAADAPRAFTRLTVVVLWGWIGMSLAIWAVSIPSRRRDKAHEPFVEIAVAVGRAHIALIPLPFVLFLAAGMPELRWIGLVAAVVVFGAWFPARLVAGIGRTLHAHAVLSVAIVAPAYGLWLAAIGRHLHTQLGHLI